MRVINFLQVIGSSIPVNEGKNVSSHGNLVIEKSSAKSGTEEFSDMEPHFDFDEFPELNNDEQSSDGIYDTISHASPKRKRTHPDSITKLPRKCEPELSTPTDENSPRTKVVCVTGNNDSSSPVHGNNSRRTRRIPRRYTPNSNENSLYCLCNEEDCGWYVSGV